jgi:hypothetical protein
VPFTFVSAVVLGLIFVCNEIEKCNLIYLLTWKSNASAQFLDYPPFSKVISNITSVGFYISICIISYF